ncbi:MAG: hypothetical protein GPJ51_02455 [Candidatus Heimdallarchaeota archaeon]|nr:hypothetical protein [Candidatus Heimdallarchaeota archaeon]
MFEEMGYDMVLMDLNEIFNEIESTKNEEEKWSLLFDKALEKIQVLYLSKGKGQISSVIVPGLDSMSGVFLKNMAKCMQELMKLETPNLEKFAKTKIYFVYLVRKLAPKIDVDEIYESVYSDFEELAKTDSKHYDTLITFMKSLAEELIEESEPRQATIKYKEIVDFIRENKDNMQHYEQIMASTLSRYSHMLRLIFDFSGALEEHKKTIEKIDPRYVQDELSLYGDLIQYYQEIELLLNGNDFEERNSLLSDCYLKLSDLKFIFEEIDEGLNYLNKRLNLLQEIVKEFDITKQTDPKIDIGITKSKIAEIKFGMGNPSEAFNEALEAVEILETMHSKYGRLEKDLGFASLILASIAYNTDQMNERIVEIAVRGWDMHGSNLKENEPFPFFAFSSFTPIVEGLDKANRTEEAIKAGQKILDSLEFNMSVMGEEMKSAIITRQTYVYGTLSILNIKMKKEQEAFNLLKGFADHLLNEYKLKEKLHDSSNFTTYVQLMYFMVFAASAIEDYELSVYHAEEVLNYMPDNPQILNIYAWSLMKLSRFDEAEIHARKALSANDTIANTWDTLANILEGQGKTKQAEEAYKKSLEIDDKAKTVWENYGEFLKKQGRDKEAEEAFSNVKELEKTGD